MVSPQIAIQPDQADITEKQFALRFAISQASRTIEGVADQFQAALLAEKKVSTDLARRLAELEKENSALKARLAELEPGKLPVTPGE